MSKRRAYPASQIAYLMNLSPPAKTATGQDIKYGRKALVGQYTRRETLVGHTPPGRVSKGALARAERDDGAEVTRDLSHLINSRRHV